MPAAFLLIALLMLDTASTVEFGLLCNKNPTISRATHEPRYILPPQSGAGEQLFCCTTIVIADAEMPLLLLEILRPSAAACEAALAAIPDSESLFSYIEGRLLLSTALLCKEPAVRYMMAANGTRICFSSSTASLGAATRLFAFSAVAARNLCDASAWHGTSKAIGERLEYVFAPDERLPPQLLSSVACDSSKDYSRVILSKNSSSSAVRVEILAAPASSNCKSLFVQGRSAHDNNCLVVVPGRQLMISYDRSNSSFCYTKPFTGFVVRLSSIIDAKSGSSAGDDCAISTDGTNAVVVISLSCTAAVLLATAAVTLIVWRVLRRRLQKRQQHYPEVITMQDNELYVVQQLKRQMHL